MQIRIGPNRVGPAGLLQPIADGVKLLFKEVILPTNASKALYILGPMMMLMPAIAAWAVVPFAPEVVLADINAGLLYLMALTSMGVYGVIIAGWASNSKYAFLGAMRSAAQMVSYELAMGFALVVVLMVSGSLNLSDIVQAQGRGRFADMGLGLLSWNWLPLAPILFVYFVSGVAETNRAPFDVVEALEGLVRVRIAQMVSEAEARKSPTQRFTDKFEKIFVPAVLMLAFLLLFAWVVVDEPFRDSFYRAMAVLVAASPCALAIATPSAVLSGIARAARGGVLIKGGAPLEELGSLSAMAFDKTGTLTEGRPRITDVIPAEGVAEEELLTVAVSVESLSDHPLAAAIARDGRERIGSRVVPEAGALENLIGRGVKASFEGQPVWIGKAEMFGVDGVPKLGGFVEAAIARLREAGRTTMVVRLGDRDLGAIGLLDTPRAGAREALDRLRKLGIKRMIMISGDHKKVAEAVAKDVGLDEAWGDLMPEDKVTSIRKLRETTKVAMVGDGVNDAPAMANATVGIAMGAAGSDVALETADVALMADDLRHLPFAVGLSRHTRSVIRQNVFVSLGVVAILVPATIMGLGIGAAVAVHEGSTLLVVFNALRLLAYRSDE